MHVQIFTLTVSASRDFVFNFLADVENLPKWAGGYWERITLQRGRWWALTADGEQVVEIAASPDAGVIDVWGGPSPERVTLTPIRVIALSACCTLVSFTFIEADDLGPGAFARRCQILRDEIEKLPQRFGGGQLHRSHEMPWLVELGLN